MTLIPVIDLLRGQVVRGVRGDRAAYRPIRSALCASSDPVTVARLLCEHCDARQLYIADLDALMGGPAQLDVLRAVLQALPQIELWLDAGFADAPAARALVDRLELTMQMQPQRPSQPQPSRIVPVYGSESLVSAEALHDCFAPADPLGARAVLSLDRRDGRRLDAAGAWDAPAAWPHRVIVMTMEQVGSGAGPDLQTMCELRRLAPAAWLVGAGGVRNEDDLAAATEAGADAWLVASALHDLQLPRVRR